MGARYILVQIERKKSNPLPFSFNKNRSLQQKCVSVEAGCDTHIPPVMGEMWKQCASWLCRLEVLPSNHQITWDDAGIQDLAYALRDGVLLCHVAAAIDPNAIDMKVVNQRPQMAQFLCLKNIRYNNI